MAVVQRKRRFNTTRRVIRSVGAKAGKSSLNFAKDLWLSVKVVLQSVPAMIAFGFVLVLAITHTTDKAEGAIHNWADQYPNNALFHYASNYFAKLIGALSFVPVFILLPSRSFPPLVMLLVGVVLAILPEANFYQYTLMAYCLHMFVHARLAVTRILTLCFAAGYILFLHHMLTSAEHPGVYFKKVMTEGLHLQPTQDVRQPPQPQQQAQQEQQARLQTNRLQRNAIYDSPGSNPDLSENSGVLKGGIKDRIDAYNKKIGV